VNPIDRLRELIHFSDVDFSEQLGDRHLLVTFYDGSRLLITAEVV
jgi:hypothetical protein